MRGESDFLGQFIETEKSDLQGVVVGSQFTADRSCQIQNENGIHAGIVISRINLEQTIKLYVESSFFTNLADGRF